MPTRTRLCTAGLLGLTLLAADTPPDKQTADDIAAVKTYLERNQAGKKWQGGPTRVDNAAVQAAYGKRRFYAVVSTPPLPPGAPLPDLIKHFQDQMADYQKNYISLTMAIGENGQITPLTRPEDYNVGLMKVASDDAAKKAAAAILSLYSGGGAGLGAVPADQVRVTKTDRGWTCQATKPGVYAGNVSFDAEGKCTGVNKVSIRPLPPSAPPRR
jgi:hypothetical protein